MGSVAVYTQMYGEINQDHQVVIDETLFSASSIDQNAVHPTVLIPLPLCFTCISITDFYNSPSAVSMVMTSGRFRTHEHHHSNYKLDLKLHIRNIQKKDF